MKEEEADRAETLNTAYSGFRYEAEDMPVRTRIARVYREFYSDRKEITTMALKKMRTEADLAQYTQEPPKKQQLGGGYAPVKFDDEKCTELPHVEVSTLPRLLMCVRIKTHLWSLCGARLVASELEFDPVSHEPEKVMQFHMMTGTWYYGMIHRKIIDHPGGAAEKMEWVIDRHRRTCNKARALFQQGYPWVGGL